MTARYLHDAQPDPGHPLVPGAAPHDIRAHLLPEDRHGFDAAYAKALTVARDSLDLTELFRTLEQWRRLAVTQQDPDEYRRMMAKAEHVLSTGEPVPGSVPWTQLKAELGL